MDNIFFHDTLSIDLPDDFMDMEESIADIIYTAENRPKIIKTSGDKKVNLTLSETSMDINSQMLRQVLGMIKQNIRRCQPANIFFEEKCEKLENIEFGWFDFKGFAVDGPIYYINAFPIVGGKMYHVSFSTAFTEMEVQKPKMLSILRTMKDMTKGR